MVTSVKSPTNKDKFAVGDLVTASNGKLIYMLLARNRNIPRRTGSGTLTGVCVWTAGGKDRDGDELPPIGFYHDNLGEHNLTAYHGSITITA